MECKSEDSREKYKMRYMRDSWKKHTHLRVTILDIVKIREYLTWL